MGLPRTPEAKPYYRAAKLRFEEAEILLGFDKKIGAVYLAGYTVECYLKALILDGAARHLRKKLLATFRGSRAHDIEWLRDQYRRHVRAAIPFEVARHLARVSAWDTDLRYATEAKAQGDAAAFIKSVFEIQAWANGRL
jgi:HEPN domain-containing protein